MPVSKIGDSSAKSLVSGLESSLETPAEKRARLISVFVAHASMFLSGFGNSLIYIGMYPYIVSVKDTLLSHLFKYFWLRQEFKKG